MEQTAGGRRAERGADLGIGSILTAAFLLLYLRTLCPTVYLGDSGEISTAIFTGGVIHPPGYPLFGLLGRAALAVVPVGEPAYRIGCLVALAAALTVGALYLLGRAADLSRWAAATAAAFFGASFTFWNQSTRVEVYSLHVLLSTLLLLFVLHYRRTGALRFLALACLAAALGLGQHLTIVLLGPAVLVLLGARFWTAPGLGRRLGVALPLLLIGPLLYGLLMLWARAEPLYSWGHVVDLPSLWRHASARIYQGNLKLPDGGWLGIRLNETSELWQDNFPFLLVLAPLAGGCCLWKRDRTLAAALGAACGVISLYNLCYRIPDIAAYFLNAWMISAVLLGVALDAAVKRVPSSWRHPGALAVACMALVAAPIARNWSHCDLSRATYVREFAQQKLESADRNAVLLLQGDQDSAPIFYAHDALGIRRDVLPLNRPLLRAAWCSRPGEYDFWYLRHLRACGLNVELREPADRREANYYARDGYLVGLLKGPLRDRPLDTTWLTSTAQQDDQELLAWIQRRYTQVPLGLLIRLLPAGRAVDKRELLRDNERIWSRIQLPDLHAARLDQDMDGSYLPEHYATMLVNFGGLYELNGDRPRAEAAYRRAAEWNPGFKPAQDALALLRGGSSRGGAVAARG